MASGPPSYRGASPPPAYESRPASLHEYRSPPPAFAGHPQTGQTGDTTKQNQSANSSPMKLHESADELEPAEGRTNKPRLSLIQAYKDKRRAKEATRKVDYYERLYGFVPKNAMTEAEWRDARERVPKTKVPFRAKGKGMTALGLGGFGGGGGC